MEVGLGETANRLFENGIFHNTPWTLKADMKVYDAVELWTAHGTDAVMLLDDDEEYVGILSQRDYLRKVTLLDKSSKETKCSEIMTRKTNLITVSPDDSLMHCMKAMLARDIRHLPIVEDGKLKGLLSIKDLIEAAMKQKDAMIKRLSQGSLGSLHPNDM